MSVSFNVSTAGTSTLLEPLVVSGLSASDDEKVKDYLRVKDAAELLGVSPNTLRNWAGDGTIRVRRNPVSRVRW